VLCGNFNAVSLHRNFIESSEFYHQSTALKMLFLFHQHLAHLRADGSVAGVAKHFIIPVV
jgi:hypothetical protein